MGKHNTLRLTEQQRADLERLTRKGSAAARVQTRARILLLTDRSQGQNRPDHVVADALGCSRTSVVIIRRLYLQEGPEAALYEKARPGAVPKITGDIEAKVTALSRRRSRPWPAPTRPKGMRAGRCAFWPTES
jgi:hypothetical protein